MAVAEPQSSGGEHSRHRSPAKLPVSNNPLLWVTLNGNLFEGVDRDSGAIDGPPTGLTVTRRDPCNPRASFDAATFSVTEGEVVTVTVELALAAVEAVTIPIAVTHNGGASAADYSLEPASSSLTFDIGEVSKPFTITATDDSDNDDGESLTLRFGTLPAGVNAGSPATATVNITDNDVPTVPTVTIAGAGGIVVVGGANQVNGASFDVTITFSENVGATFDHTDITVTNAQSLTATDVSASTAGLIYTATIRPTAGFSGAVTVQVPADAAQNASDEGNQASNVFSATATMQSACVTGGAVPAGDEYAGLARDCEILLGLHDTLVGSATLSPAWSVSTDIVTWLGITTGAMRVTRIRLGGTSLTGVIPPELGDLDRLTHLSLWSNELTGEIPPELGGLSMLFSLDLSSNLLSGEIPPELGDLSKLEFLELSSNQLSGAIPGELGALEELSNLLLNSNVLTGTIPMELGSLAKLSSLFLGYNQLSGPIPDTLGNLSELESLSLRNNQFNSAIPDALTQIDSLVSLYLNRNQLTGPVPDFSDMMNLRNLVLDRNQLSGAVAPVSNLPNLEDYLIHRNKLTGSIPTMTNVPKLESAWFHCNQFSGEIPASFNNITSLTVLLFFDNQLTGEIPDLSALDSLEELFLNHNHLEGDFSDTASLLAKLPVVSSLLVTLNGNLFAGVDRDSGAIDSPPSWLTVDREDPCNPRASFDAATFSVTEGEVVTVTVELARAATDTVTIPINVTHNGGASEDDYSGEPENVIFNSGEMSKTFTIMATDDSDNDDGESLTLSFGTLPAGVNAGSPATATVNITDDDVPSVTVRYEQASYTVGEGNSEDIKVILSADPERTVTIPIPRSNQDGAGNGDYSGVPTSLTFNSGDTEKSFTFTAVQDIVDDDGESVLLSFGTLPTGVSAGSPATATVNITDDDVPFVTARYEQSIYTVAEGSSVVIKVILSADPERTVTVPIPRINQGGAGNGDYSGVPTSLTFNSGDTEKSFTFTAVQDSVDDDGESVKLGFDMLPEGWSLGINGEATVNITDDDVPTVTVRYEQSIYTVAEGSSVVIKVILSADPERTVTIPINKANQGGATNGDYSGVPANASVTFNSGDTEKSITFTATNDSVDDDGESVLLSFGTLPTGVSAGSPATATVNITDDDVPSVTVRYEQASYTVGEGSSVVVKVILSADPERSVTVPINKANQGGATNGDYSGVAANASVTFNSGEMEKSITFTATDDSVDDDGESVLLSFGTLPTGVSAGSPATATVNITDDDVPTVTVRYEQASYTVGEGSSVVVKVILSADPERTVTIPINKANQGGATDGDYSGVAANASVTFNSGDTEKSITFAATDDSVDDDDESVLLSFGTLPTGVSAGSPAMATVNITDDDVPTVTVRYEQASYTVGEGSSEVIKVILSADPERSVTIPISRTNQDGASNGDYSGVPANASVTFNSGDTEKSITFAATDDGVDDDGESVLLGFGTLPTGVSAGSPATATVNITDDDVPAVTVSYKQATYTVGGAAG